MTDVSISAGKSASQTNTGKNPVTGRTEAATWARCAWEIFRKDVRVELRTRYAIGSVALFSLTTIVMVSAALSTALVKSEVEAALIWIVLLFAALSGLARAFVREEEAGTAAGLRLSAPATAVYAGKLLFNLMLVGTVELITVPLFSVFMPVHQVRYDLFIPILVAGGWGLAAAATFISVMIAQTSSGKSALFAIVSFPVLMPLLLPSVYGTTGAFSPVATYQLNARADIGDLFVYAVVMTTASFILFEYVWHD